MPISKVRSLPILCYNISVGYSDCVLPYSVCELGMANRQEDIISVSSIEYQTTSSRGMSPIELFVYQLSARFDFKAFFFKLLSMIFSQKTFMCSQLLNMNLLLMLILIK